MKVLILFAHPAFEKSTVNKSLLKGIRSLDDVTLHDLYEAYPEFDIDVKREQKLLSEHDCIIFHHPLFWLSTPAILKEWQDLVLEHGWAFGQKGNALKGKLFFNVLSTGAPKSAYTKEGYEHYTINEFLVPIRQTAEICKMIPLPPFVIHGTHAIENIDLEKYRIHYHSLLKCIASGETDIEKALHLDHLNDYPLKNNKNA